MIRDLQTRKGAVRLERPGNEEQFPVGVLHRSEAAAPHHRQGDLSHLTGLSAAVGYSRECAIGSVRFPEYEFEIVGSVPDGGEQLTRTEYARRDGTDFPSARAREFSYDCWHVGPSTRSSGGVLKQCAIAIVGSALSWRSDYARNRRDDF